MNNMMWNEIKKALAAGSGEGNVVVEYNKRVLERIQQDIDRRAKMTSEDCEVEEGDTNDLLVNLGCAIAGQLDHKWEDQGIGRYEFWGSRGTDVNWQPVLQTESVWVEFPANVTFIPTVVKGRYSGGGECDEDTPRHRCGRNCEFVTIPFTAMMFQTLPGEDGKFLVEYSIQQGD